MTIFEICSIVIAIASICIALITTWKERRRSMYDNLHMCYQKLRETQASEPICTPAEHIFFEENPHDVNTEKYKEESRKTQQKIDNELEFACYWVVNKQINLKPFCHLFGKWLEGRSEFWKSTRNHHRAKNNPYTVKVIIMCEDKKFLPIDENKEISNLNKTTDKFIVERKQTNIF